MRTIIESTDFTRHRSEYWPDLLSRLPYGNIVEIGGGFGESAETFCKYADNVLVIDPYEEGWEDMPKSYQYAYSKFRNNTAHLNNLTLHKYASQHESCAAVIEQFKPISFCFIDGLQFKDAVLSDIALMEQFEPLIICIDDANRLGGQSEVPLALEAYTGRYQLIYQGREAYLCL